VSPVRYELGFYIPEYDILHSHRRENLRSYIVPTSYREALLSPLLQTAALSFYTIAECTGKDCK
jgi:hypothetical protein